MYEISLTMEPYTNLIFCISSNSRNKDDFRTINMTVRECNEFYSSLIKYLRLFNFTIINQVKNVPVNIFVRTTTTTETLITKLLLVILFIRRKKVSGKSTLENP